MRASTGMNRSDWKALNACRSPFRAVTRRDGDAAATRSAEIGYVYVRVRRRGHGPKRVASPSALMTPEPSTVTSPTFGATRRWSPAQNGSSGSGTA